MFPKGLSRDPVPAGLPALGVFVEQDSPGANKLGLQASDVIAAVDGWRVDNMVRSTRVIRAFPLEGGFTLTVARGATRLDEPTISQSRVRARLQDRQLSRAGVDRE